MCTISQGIYIISWLAKFLSKLFQVHQTIFGSRMLLVMPYGSDFSTEGNNGGGQFDLQALSSPDHPNRQANRNLCTYPAICGLGRYHYCVTVLELASSVIRNLKRVLLMNCSQHMSPGTPILFANDGISAHEYVPINEITSTCFSQHVNKTTIDLRGFVDPFVVGSR